MALGLRRPKKAEPPDPPRRGNALVELLKQSCGRAASALVLPMDLGVACSALLLDVTDDSITLALPLHDHREIRSLTPCVVTFPHGGQTVTFVSRIRESVRKHASIELILELPTQVLDVEHRTSFRVPLIGEHGLAVRIQTAGGREWQVNPVDISAGGMLIEFRAEDPNLPMNTDLMVELGLGGDRLRLRASVRRHHGHSYGLMFPDSFKEGEIVAPEALGRLVNKLERHWLLQRSTRRND